MKRKLEVGLVKGEERSLPNLAEVRELVNGLEESEQKVVMEETIEFYRARQAGMLSYLEMGEHLAKVRDVLEPRELWKKFASSLPNMGIATAYRMIWAWENAQRALPNAALRIVARDGYRIISSEKGTDFAPGYDRAVKSVEKELGPPPDDEQKAREWIEAVVEKKKKLGKLSRPIDARRGSVVGKVNTLIARVERVLATIPEPKRANFLQRLINGLMDVSVAGKRPAGKVAAAA